MDTISSDGFSKTKINKPMERKTEELSEEEKEKRMKKFVKHNEKDLKVSRTTPAGTSSPITQPFSKDTFTYFLSLFGLSVFSSFQSLDLELSKILLCIYHRDRSLHIERACSAYAEPTVKLNQFIKFE